MITKGRNGKNQTGFTLIEVMIAAVVLSIALLGFMALVPTVAQLSETAGESNAALAASHQLSEAIRQYADSDFGYVYRAYNSATTDDPNGTGTAPGATFTVSGLPTAVGTVTFYTDENENEPKVGLPNRDLNNNGLTTDADVSADYTVLPFKITVTWSDQRKLQQQTEIFSQVIDY